MTKKQIKKLAYSGYTKNILDIKKVNRITKHLTRQELKNYIKFIKLIENNKKVTVLMPKTFGKEKITGEVKKIFLEKRIIIKEDNSLIAGLRIINNDTIYDFNLKNTFENLISYINN